MLIAGVDEAGRGCVIGPLVVAGIAMEAENLQFLSQLGVKDSKLLSPKRREELYLEIAKSAKVFHTIKLAPCQIDKVVESQRKLHKLNRLEAQTMAQIIDFLKPDEVYVDAADVLEDRFKQHIQECLMTKPKIIAKHKADKTYPIVSAASIIAKVQRDQEIANLRAEHGDFGSGYLTDEKTMLFINHLLEKNSSYPDFIRKSWKPAKKALNDRKLHQTKLF